MKVHHPTQLCYNKFMKLHNYISLNLIAISWLVYLIFLYLDKNHYIFFLVLSFLSYIIFLFFMQEFLKSKINKIKYKIIFENKPLNIIHSILFYIGMTLFFLVFTFAYLRYYRTLFLIT